MAPNVSTIVIVTMSIALIFASNSPPHRGVLSLWHKSSLLSNRRLRRGCARNSSGAIPLGGLWELRGSGVGSTTCPLLYQGAISNLGF